MDKPPSIEAPALFDTAVKLLRESIPRRWMAAINVSVRQIYCQHCEKLCEKWPWPKKECSPAVPQRPNPALRMVDPLLISATASSASLKSFDAPRSILGA